MKIIMYGTGICTDCVKAKELIDRNNNIELEYKNITESTATMKEFLAYRDHDSMFAPVREEGKIGIPFFILEDGTKTFDISDYMDMDEPDSKKDINACSIDGKGC